MPLSALGNYIQLTDASAHFFPVDALEDLGDLMIKMSGANGASTINAAYVYFGQFIAHDLTRLHIGSDNPNPNHRLPLSELRLDRSPVFDLDSIYGQGWKDKDCAICKDSGKLCLGKTITAGEYHADFDDLPRHRNLTARIPDSRNDENLFVAQLHVLFHKLHNIVVDQITDQFSLHPRAIFEAARSEVISIYQQIVLYDFLPTLLDDEILKFVLENPDLGLFKVDDSTRSMPIEFSVAAYRFGHSMVLPQYPQKRRRGNLSVKDLFTFTGESKNAFEGAAGLPADRVVDWRLMLNDARTKAALIDPNIFKSPVPVPEGQITNLATRNLFRGNQVGLPSAQDLISKLVARHEELGRLIVPLDTAELVVLDNLQNMEHADHMRKHTPLWYYILEEAESPDQHNGKKLGKLGSLIVATTFIEILRAMPTSIFHAESKPNVLPLSRNKPFTLAKLVDLVQPKPTGE